MEPAGAAATKETAWAGAAQTGSTAEEPPAAACSIDERWNEQGLAAAADVTCMCAAEGFALQGDRRVEEGKEGGREQSGGGWWWGSSAAGAPDAERGWSGDGSELRWL